MKKILVLMIIAISFLAACPKSGEVAERQPVQSASDPATGQDMTADYLSSKLEEYFKGRDLIFDEAQKRRDAGEETQALLDEMMKKLDELQRITYTAVKHIPEIGGVNLPKTFEKDRETLKNIITGASEY